MLFVTIHMESVTQNLAGLLVASFACKDRNKDMVWMALKKLFLGVIYEVQNKCEKGKAKLHLLLTDPLNTVEEDMKQFVQALVSIFSLFG